MTRSRRIYQKELRRRGHTDNVATRLKAVFLRNRLDMGRMVRTAKRTSWRAFVKENSTNPWGVVYKIMAGKIKPQTVLATLSTEEGYTSGGRDIGDRFLEVLLPMDGREDGLPRHGEVRRLVSEEDNFILSEDRRALDDDVVTRLLADFRRSRTELKRIVLTAKRSSWRNFVKEKSSNPWGIV